MAGYGLMGKRLQPARFRNLYGGLQLRETTAAYGSLRRRLRGLPNHPRIDAFGHRHQSTCVGVAVGGYDQRWIGRNTMPFGVLNEHAEWTKKVGPLRSKTLIFCIRLQNASSNVHGL